MHLRALHDDLCAMNVHTLTRHISRNYITSNIEIRSLMLSDLSRFRKDKEVNWCTALTLVHADQYAHTYT